MKKYKYLLFDLDGTLVDSGEGIMKCAQYALAAFGIEIKDLQTLRPFVGPPLEDSFIDFYGFSKEDAAKAVATYRERYFKKGVYEQELYPMVKEFLSEVRSLDHVMAIATSKTTVQAEFVTKHFGLSEYFDYVFGRDEAGLLHTKADVINNGLRQMNVTNNAEVLMIGDRKFDIAGAKECNLDSLGVLYGYGDRKEMEQADADYICSSFEEILNFLRA